MEESEITFSLEDIVKMLERFKGGTLYPLTIDNIIDDFQRIYIKRLKNPEIVHNTESDIEKLRKMFFKRICVHSNWSAEHIMKAWDLSELELSRLKEEGSKCPKCGFKK